MTPQLPFLSTRTARAFQVVVAGDRDTQIYVAGFTSRAVAHDLFTLLKPDQPALKRSDIVVRRAAEYDEQARSLKGVIGSLDTRTGHVTGILCKEPYDPPRHG